MGLKKSYMTLKACSSSAEIKAEKISKSNETFIDSEGHVKPQWECFEKEINGVKVPFYLDKKRRDYYYFEWCARRDKDAGLLKEYWHRVPANNIIVTINEQKCFHSFTKNK